MTAIRHALQGAREQFDFCTHALSYFEKKDESSRKVGANVILQSGRAITYGMETLAKASHEFATWYRPYGAELHADPILKYFREVRNVIVHRSGRIELNHISTVPINDPKPGAIEELIADGSTIDHMNIDFLKNRRYLVVRTPYGRREERDVPQRREGPWWLLVDVQSYFKDAPVEFAGVTVVESCQRYVRFLGRLIQDAEVRFGM